MKQFIMSIKAIRNIPLQIRIIRLKTINKLHQSIMFLRAILLAAIAYCTPLLAQNKTAPSLTKPSTDLATISNRDEASKQVGNIALLKGKYTAFTLAHVKGMKRFAKIELSDNSQVFIETGKKAKRKKAEYKKMLGKEVNAIGKIAEKIPLNIKGAPRLIGALVLCDAQISEKQ